MSNHQMNFLRTQPSNFYMSKAKEAQAYFSCFIIVGAHLVYLVIAVVVVNPLSFSFIVSLLFYPILVPPREIIFSFIILAFKL